MDSTVCLVYLTTPSIEVARQVSVALLKEKLIACANIGSSTVESHYVWDGQLQSAQEVQVWLKTTAKKFDLVSRRITELHPYDCPAILQIKVDGGLPQFLDWIQSSVSSL